MMRRVGLPALALVSFLAIAAAQQGTSPDPWAAGDLIQPEALAATLRDGTTQPVILYVGFPVLYRAAHIPGAILAGPVSKPEGLDALKAALAATPRDRPVVLYCGCCPWEKCPNVRPAFKLVREMGFRQAKLVTIATNLHTDWTSKGYPVERAADHK